MLAITAKKPNMNGTDLKNYEREPFLREFDKLVDVIIDNQQELPSSETTILDMTDDNTKVLRRGLGIEQVEEVFRMQQEPLEEIG
jgi:tRNA A37 threonylcarbamoyladenosine synthetase subunit TsaC/SUA5/YrdC